MTGQKHSVDWREVEKRINGIIQWQFQWVSQSLAALGMDVADLVQEVLITTELKYRRTGNQKAFTYTALCNAIIDQLRVVARHRAKSPTCVGYEKDVTLGFRSADPAQLAEKAEELELLQQSINDLPAPLRKTIDLILKGVGRKEIGDALGISRGQVWRREFRAYCILRESFSSRKTPE